MNLTLDLFSQPKTEGYSHATSGVAYRSNPEKKLACKERLFLIIQRLKSTTLLELHEITGLPQSSVSGRIADLIQEGRVKYSSRQDYVFYKGQLRKKILVA